jgi:AcrR family transcriptional regulator
VRGTPQQERSRETVERVLAAADREFGEVGPAAASTRSVAARAGVSVGALYRFFADKDALADALARRYLEHVGPPFEAALAGVHDAASAVEAVRRVVEAAAVLQLEHPGYYRLTEERSPDRLDSPAHAVRETLVDRFVVALRSAGADLPDERLRPSVGLVVETVRHTLVRAPVDAAARAVVVDELAHLVSGYVGARLLALSAAGAGAAAGR